jgi:RsiW-degrading membrane proteinase PrsW (M82 family)
MNFCGTSTPAGKRYQRRVIVTMVVYMAVLFGAISVVKHTHPHGWLLYAISVLPAVPILAMMGALGVYLQEEKDEYLRLITMRSLLVGSAALLAVLVVNDFLRSISGAAALPEFTSWVLFFVVFGLAQAVQTMRNRVKDDA